MSLQSGCGTFAWCPGGGTQGFSTLFTAWLLLEGVPRLAEC